MTTVTRDAPELGVEIIPGDLHRAWELPSSPVEVWEYAGPAAGLSVYTLAGASTRIVLMETLAPGMGTVLVLAALGRVIANCTGVCPACSARSRLEPQLYEGRPVDGLMEHDGRCPLSDAGLRVAARDTGGSAPPMPDLPRYWVAWVPRLRPGYRARPSFGTPPGRGAFLPGFRIQRTALAAKTGVACAMTSGWPR